MAFGELFRRKSIESTIRDVQASDAGHGTGLHRTLGVRDLTAFGVAAVIGGGIFTAVGKASFDGGPGIIFLYIFTALACGLAAYCYAEFASAVPISGSAYTYAYVTFGELIAWIIGWDLLMEYAIGNVAVAISWSGYFTNLLEGFHIHVPAFLTADYPSAHQAFRDVSDQLAGGTTLDQITDKGLVENYNAWITAPGSGAFKLILDLPALFIVAVITYVVFIGIKESRNTTNWMVGLKLAVIFLVIVLGSFYVHPDNWSPFTPNGLAGIMKGVSAVFFAYIGFDAISTTAEECKNPQRDLPKGMFYSLIICTVLYILISLVLTGMTSYLNLNVEDPLADVFKSIGLNQIAYIISISAVVATASVLLVFQLGQPRIWMSMSRDGLLPKIFSRIHPKYKTPSFSTLLTGLLVAVPALFLNLDWVLSLTSIGTLFAFVLVCGGVLILQNNKARPKTGFKVPYINGKYIVPILFVITWILLLIYDKDGVVHTLTAANGTQSIPMLTFIVVSIIITILSFQKNYSLIPVLGLLSCMYLLTGESWTNWARFIIWLIVGLIIYFSYSRYNSRLNKKNGGDTGMGGMPHSSNPSAIPDINELLN